MTCREWNTYRSRHIPGARSSMSQPLAVGLRPANFHVKNLSAQFAAVQGPAVFMRTSPLDVARSVEIEADHRHGAATRLAPERKTYERVAAGVLHVHPDHHDRKQGLYQDSRSSAPAARTR